MRIRIRRLKRLKRIRMRIRMLRELKRIRMRRKLRSPATAPDGCCFLG